MCAYYIDIVIVLRKELCDDGGVVAGLEKVVRCTSCVKSCLLAPATVSECTKSKSAPMFTCFHIPPPFDPTFNDCVYHRVRNMEGCVIYVFGLVGRECF